MANEKTFQSRIQLKHDSLENWNKATNFVPKAGEIIIYDADATNPIRLKIGDGTTKVNDLPFILQDKLIGTEGQMIQFDASGNPVAVNPVFITVEDIDTICGGAISYAEDVMF